MNQNQELLKRSIKIDGLPQYYIYKDIQSKFEVYGEIDFVKYGRNEAILVFKSELTVEDALKIKCFNLGESIVTISQAQDLNLSEEDYEFITEEKQEIEQTKGEKLEQDQEIKQDVECQNKNEQLNDIGESKYVSMIFSFNYFFIVLLAWTLYNFLI